MLDGWGKFSDLVTPHDKERKKSSSWSPLLVSWWVFFSGENQMSQKWCSSLNKFCSLPTEPTKMPLCELSHAA